LVLPACFASPLTSWFELRLASPHLSSLITVGRLVRLRFTLVCCLFCFVLFCFVLFCFVYLIRLVLLELDLFLLSYFFGLFSVHVTIPNRVTVTGMDVLSL
jgi:hypothetical protein